MDTSPVPEGTKYPFRCRLTDEYIQAWTKRNDPTPHLAAWIRTHGRAFGEDDGEVWVEFDDGSVGWFDPKDLEKIDE